MADRMEANGASPVVVTDSTWSQLFAETMDEVARIVRTEIRLAEASLSRMVENQTERVLGAVLLLAALICGSMFVLGSVVLLIHQWLAWWLSLGITGIVIIAAGFGSQRINGATRGQQKLLDRLPAILYGPGEVFGFPR